jgi:hypothetical protein
MSSTMLKVKGQGTVAQGTRRAAQLSQQQLEDAKCKRGCARCKAEGLVKEAVGHKGSNCPYSSAVAPIVISDSDNDADSEFNDESE